MALICCVTFGNEAKCGRLSSCEVTVLYVFTLIPVFIIYKIVPLVFSSLFENRASKGGLRKIIQGNVNNYDLFRALWYFVCPKGKGPIGLRKSSMFWTSETREEKTDYYFLQMALEVKTRTEPNSGKTPDKQKVISLNKKIN